MTKEPIESLGLLKKQLQMLPGIGARSAERIAFHVLREKKAYAEALARAILDVKEKIRHCSVCFNLTEADPCAVCCSADRRHEEIWVVEQPSDVMAMEETGLISGVYHVLMGHIAPLDGIEPEDLTIEQLVARVEKGGVAEVVLALNPTLDGDATALFVKSRLDPSGVKVTRPARGLAVGSQLEYASVAMLQSAIKGRSSL